jgi:CDP-diglyceride synthetase
MKVRIISSLVASALLFFVMFMPLWVFLIALTCVAVIAVLEYMGSVRLKGYNVSLWPITVIPPYRMGTDVETGLA